ncbi:NAD(P)/FAD-dependent oxidoreductase [Leucobacter japonicus]|uniref:NAD(P)/FAD-dependent oxidoreductase n=1 Tax=Leucobacter japonicus TaxID=1461259 RepID=UPI0009E2CDF3|nr:FAD-dependent oxidoreductase [Leucobacter japonicus]
MQRPTTFETAEARADFSRAKRLLAHARRTSFWLDDLGETEAHPPLAGDTTTDLLVVGGGYNGLWAALRSKERYPDREVVLIEAKRLGWAASGRNGGFCEPSLTHGRANAAIHVPGEEAILAELGEKNLADLLATLERYGIECDVRPHGVIKLATEPHQVPALEALAASDSSVRVLRGPELQAQVRTAAAEVGGWATEEGVVLNPARLVRGLAEACRSLGVRFYEDTPATGLRSLGRDAGVEVTTPRASIRARHVALATNGFPSLLRSTRLHTVPVYDYAVVTDPLTAEQRASLGWDLEQGVTDMNNRFHYMRLLTDADGRERLLLGGYDALYHFGRRVRPEYDVSESTFERLTVHLETLFPQLMGVQYSHAWGGMIDTCSRFFAFFTRAHHGQVVAAAGFTGLGVAATRFAADVMLDLLHGESTERTRTSLVRKRPMPFPPEPFAWPAIRFTSAMMARSDRRGGKSGAWLWLLEKLKLGFDS